MEGTLLKKTTNNVWHARKFKLERSTLSWPKSDNKTEVVVDLAKNCTVRDVKFGPKKFAFDVCLPGEVISLSASGEAEKAAWMSALTAAMGKKKEAEAIFTNSVAGSKSVRASLAANKTAASPTAAAAAASAAPATTTTSATTPAAKPAATTTATASDLVNQANNKLAAKLGGRVMVSAQVLCAVCKTPVYKMEELIVDKATMHKKCFQCNHCKRQLTLGNFAVINSTMYCKPHYFELFSQSGGKYDKAFGDGGFQHKALTSYTPPTAAEKQKVAAAAKQPATTTAPVVPVVVAAKPASPEVPAVEAKPAPVAAEVPAAKPQSPKAAAAPVPVAAAAAKPAPGKLPVKETTKPTAAAAKPTTAAAKPTTAAAAKLPPPGKVSAKETAKPATAVEAPKPQPQQQQPEPTPLVPASAAAAPTKPKLEVLPKKNMDELRKLVRLPGMGAPPPSPRAPEPAANAAQDGGDDGDTPTPAAAVEPPLYIRPPPMGINFALEAVKKRQAQLGITQQDASSAASTVFNESHDALGGSAVRGSVRGSTRLDHSAVLNKPKVTRRRAPPKVQDVGKVLLVKMTEVERLLHDECTFKILLQGAAASADSSSTLVLHATSLFERDHWVRTLNANIHRLHLANELAQAQKRDMMSALQAQLDLEAFTADNETTYSGFLEKLSLKSQRNWKKRWFTLTDKGELSYFETDTAKKPKQVLQLTYISVLTNAEGERMDAPLVISLAEAAGVDPAVLTAQTDNALPMNFAIFDNQEATVDLSAVFNEQGEQVAIPEESLAQDEEREKQQEEEEQLLARVGGGGGNNNNARGTLVERMLPTRLSVRDDAAAAQEEGGGGKRATLVNRLRSTRVSVREEGKLPLAAAAAAGGQPAASPRSPSIKRASQVTTAAILNLFPAKTSFSDTFEVSNSPTAAAAAAAAKAKEEEEEEEEESTPRINTAWAQPGVAPDRMSTGRGGASSVGVKPADGAGKKKKDCVVM